MEKDIMEKLTAELRNGINSEKDVLYFMAEARKMLDKGALGQYQTLRFYCNWVLHTEIEDLKDFFEFFVEVSTLVKMYLAAPNASIRRRLNFFVSDFLAFPRLKNELRSLLKEKGLSDQLVNDEPQWRAFAKHMKEIIIDSPLILDSVSKKVPDNRLKSFKLTRKSILRLPERMPFIAWEIWINTSPIPMTGFIREV